MKKFVKVMATVAVLFTFVFGLVGCSKSSFKKGTIKIGVSGPLTGGAAAYGVAVANSAQLAVDEINAKGGYKGVKFSFVALDDELQPTKAAANYTSLYEKGMQVALGAVTSGAALEFGANAKTDSVFCLTPSATNDDVPKTGIYQMCFSDSGQGTAAATYVATNYPSAKVGIFYDSSDDYSKGIYDNFKAQYTGTTVDAAFTSDTKTDFNSQVQLLTECDFIFMPIYYSEAALFIQQGKNVIKDNAVYFGCDGLDGIEGVEGFDPNAYTQEISYLSHFNAASEDQKVKDYVANYKKAYKDGPLNQFGAAAYDCVYAIYEALVASNADLNADSTAAEFYAALNAQFSGNFSFSGITGTNITWNADRTVSKQPTKYVVNAK